MKSLMDESTLKKCSCEISNQSLFSSLVIILKTARSASYFPPGPGILLCTLHSLTCTSWSRPWNLKYVLRNLEVYLGTWNMYFRTWNMYIWTYKYSLEPEICTLELKICTLEPKICTLKPEICTLEPISIAWNQKYVI